MNTVKINNKEYNVKYSIRALFIYEQITGKPFTGNLTYIIDRYIFAYSILLASNKDDIIEWDDFISAIDDDPDILLRINEIVLEQQKVNEKISGGKTGEEQDPKKD